MTDLKQINVRIPAELHDALARHKAESGEDKSDTIRRGIELALEQRTAPPLKETSPSSASEGSTAVAAAPDAPAANYYVHREEREGSDSGSSIDLATWLSGRTGIPKALCRRHVKAGRVTVDGRPYSEQSAPADYLLLPVTLDGNPV